MEWLKHYPEHAKSGMGLLVTGAQSIAPSTKCFAIAGALLRNFVDARVITRDTLLKALEAERELSPTVLLMPNLFTVTAGKSLPDWRVQLLYDALLARRAAGKPTVAYVEDLHALTEVYGTVFAQHLHDDYVQVS